MFKNFDINVVNIFKCAEKERTKLKHPYVGTEHLLLSILKNDNEMKDYFANLNLTYESFKRELIMIVGTSHTDFSMNLYTPMLKRVINNALINAKENNDGKVTTRHLLLSILEEGEGIAIRLLIGMGLDIDKVYDDLNNYKLTNKKLEIFNIGTLLNENVNFNENVIGRDKEISLIIETLLRKKKNNPILIGDAGVGKTAIVEELVRRIERKEVPESLYNTKIVSLEMGALVSGTKYRGEFEEKLTKIIKELETNENIIVFIDEIHSMVNAGGAEGAISAGDIFKPALARGKIKCIGATTNHEYNKFFSKDSALMRRFEVVNIQEPKVLETKNILLKVKNEYELHHGVIITDEVIEKIIYYTNEFITNKKNPDKAIDFLDSVCAKAKTDHNYNEKTQKMHQELNRLREEKNKYLKNNDYDNALKMYTKELEINKKIANKMSSKKILIKEEDILEVLENKTNLIFNEDKIKSLDNIKNIVSDKLYGIEEETNKIIDLIKNNFYNKKGFLKAYLEGEAYLGKSSLIKIISENIPRCDFLKIDLGEYNSTYDINKLIGTTQGYVGYNDEHIFTRLKNNNFTIILFDNFDKAHKNIKEFIKGLLKEKYITDNQGSKIYFNNTFIFITNDIESTNKVGFENNLVNKNSSELEDLVDDVIVFSKLTKDKLNKYLDKLKVEDKEYIIKNSEFEKFNYKNINRLIKNNLINN